MKVIKKKLEGNKPLLLREFSGLKDLTAFLESTPPDAGWDNHCDDSYPYRFAWAGAHSYTEAKQMLTKGTNIAEIKKAVHRGAGVTMKRQKTLGVIGACPNVPAYLAGSPACMYRVDRTRAKGAYNVFVDVGVNCGIEKSEVCEAGIEILIRVLKLASTYPVNLLVGDLSTYENKVYGCAVKIMDAGRAYNTARVSYALTEAGFLRVFGLGVIERNGRYWSSRASSGYGYPLDNEERRRVLKATYNNSILISTLEVIRDSERAFKDIDAVLAGGKRK